MIEVCWRLNPGGRSAQSSRQAARRNRSVTNMRWRPYDTALESAPGPPGF